MATRSGRLVACAYAGAQPALAILLVASAVVVLRVGFAVEAQRINVRYEPGTSDTARESAEERLGLVDGVQRERGTWSYQLERRGRRDIEAIVTEPIIEDTHYIDRTRFRVASDRPALPEPIQSLVEDGWAPWLAALFALLGTGVLWSARNMLHWAGSRATQGLRAVSPTLWHALFMTGVGAVTVLALPLLVGDRPDEATFVHVYQAPSILAGDHPYRDFFEWGAPLPAFLSAGVQWLVGYRLIGELLLQWTFTVAGVLVAVHLGMRQARSTLWVAAVVPVILLLVPRAGYHFSKLFCIPIAIWLAWRYLDRATRRRGAAMGAFTALAFLFRHDFALWAGLASVLAFALYCLMSPRTRSMRNVVIDAGAYALVLVVALLPWAILVSTGEGLASYVAARAERFAYSQDAGTRNPYAAILHMNPVSQLRTVRLPPPQKAVVSFEWESPAVAEPIAFEHQYGLRRLEPDRSGRPRYEIANVHDVDLLRLRDVIRNDAGFDWDLLEAAARGVPFQQGVMLWLAQVAMLVPMALIASGLGGVYRNGLGAAEMRVGDAQRLLAGVVLAAVCETLFREWSYVLVVAPLAAALGAQFLSPWRERGTPGPTAGAWRVRNVLGYIGSAVSITLLLLTTYAAAVWHPPVWDGSWAETVRHVREAARVWLVREHDNGSLLYAYLRACTEPGDRLLVAGSTPYYVPYYTHRAMAGGHLDWSLGLRDAPELEAASLALLQRQPVPFAVGRGDVMGEFEQYPRIREYLKEHFTEVRGTGGAILYDTRRRQVTTYGSDGRPCFR